MKIDRVFNPQTNRYSMAVLGSRERYKHMYTVYKAVKARCDNPNATGYKIYGGQGVTYDPRWKDNFSAFVEDIDSIDGWNLELFDNYKLQLDKDIKAKDKKLYSKDTCTWVTPKENHIVRPTYLGKAEPKIGYDVMSDTLYSFKSPQAFAKEFNVSTKTIESALIFNKWFSNGFTFWYSNNPRKEKIVFYELVTNSDKLIRDISIRRISIRTGIKYNTIYASYHMNYQSSMFKSIKKIEVNASDLMETHKIIKRDY